MAPPFDIWNQARLSALIKAKGQTTLEQMQRPARQLATMRPTRDDKIRMVRMSIGGAGLAPLKAIGASLPVYAPKIKADETAIELVQIGEKTPLRERLLRDLNSTDDDISERAGLDILTRGNRLFLRNENRSDKMVMDAILTGVLDIVFEDEQGQGLKVVYDIPATHFVNASDWSDPANGKPVTDLEGIQTLLGDDAGEYGRHIWMNGTTYRDAIFTQEAMALMTGSVTRVTELPESDAINTRLRGNPTWHVTDAAWRDEGEYGRGFSSANKWIPDHVVIMTTSDPFEGEPIVEMLDGLVMVRSSFETLDLRPGAQAWARITEDDTYELRQVSTRMPRINFPENIVVMDVGP